MSSMSVARARARVGRAQQQQTARIAVHAERLHQPAEPRRIVLPVAGLALQPEHAPLDHGHDVRLELAAVRQRALDVVEHLVLGRAQVRAQPLRQQHAHEDLQPAAGQELPGLAVFGRDHAQRLLRRAVIIEILQHSVAVQQRAELHGRRPLLVAEVLHLELGSAAARDQALGLLVEGRQQVEVRAEVAREVLEGLVAVEVVLTLVDEDPALLEEVHQRTGGRVLGRRPRGAHALGFDRLAVVLEEVGGALAPLVAVVAVGTVAPVVALAALGAVATIARRSAVGRTVAAATAASASAASGAFLGRVLGVRGGGRKNGEGTRLRRLGGGPTSTCRDRQRLAERSDLGLEGAQFRDEIVAGLCGTAGGSLR